MPSLYNVMYYTSCITGERKLVSYLIKETNLVINKVFITGDIDNVIVVAESEEEASSKGMESLKEYYNE